VSQPGAVLLTRRLLEDLPVALRVAIVTLTLTPMTTYLLLPWVTARLAWWLHGVRWGDRR